MLSVTARKHFQNNTQQMKESDYCGAMLKRQTLHAWSMVYFKVIPVEIKLRD